MSLQRIGVKFERKRKKLERQSKYFVKANVKQSKIKEAGEIEKS